MQHTTKLDHKKAQFSENEAYVNDLSWFQFSFLKIKKLRECVKMKRSSDKISWPH
jgi:hypothetical protein